MFGSTALHLDAGPDADLDICIVDTQNLLGGEPKNENTDDPSLPYNLPKLSEYLRSRGLRINEVITGAKTPIIKATNIQTRIRLDINVNCLSGCYNSTFLYHQAHNSTIFLPLAFFIKRWAVKNELNIPPYALNLLLLAHLLDKGAVQNLFIEHDGYGWVDQPLKVDGAHPGSEKIYQQRFSTRSGWKNHAEHFGMFELLKSFFEYAHSWLQYSRFDEINLRVEGGRASRSDLFGQPPLVLVDPFVPDRNPLASVSEEGVQRLKDAIRVTLVTVRTGGLIKMEELV